MAVAGSGPATITGNVIYNMSLLEGSSAIYLLGGTSAVTGNTFSDLHQDLWSGVVLSSNNVIELHFDHNIVASTSGAAVFDVGPPGVISLDCNVFWDNADGIGLDLDPTDLIVDPQFCDPENRDYTLQATSPCLPALSLGCGLIGALEQGCGVTSVTPSTRATWGRIKSSFRTGEE